MLFGFLYKIGILFLMNGFQLTVGILSRFMQLRIFDPCAAAIMLKSLAVFEHMRLLV